MENWLHCKLSPGQFDKELGVDGLQFNNIPFSLFVPKEYVKYDKEPSNEKQVSGLIRVEVIEQQKDMILVRLPRATFQNGPYITVTPEQLQNPVKKPAKKPSKKSTSSQRKG